MSGVLAEIFEQLRWPKKWIISILMYVYRWTTGYLTDKVFDWIYAFRKRPPSLPPVQNPILLETALGLAYKIRTGQMLQQDESKQQQTSLSEMNDLNDSPLAHEELQSNKYVSSVSVVRAFIHRIEEVNPVINAAVDDRFTESLEEAARVDGIINSGEKSEEELEQDTPLLGVPFSVKEAISVKGMLFTTGVVSRRGTRAKEDADVVAMLRRAGAIPLVVTNTSEQCFWMEAYNNLYGRTNNPYDPRKTAGGSSGQYIDFYGNNALSQTPAPLFDIGQYKAIGGEGALLASAGSVIGIGNDIGGSIRIPAFFNGIFGHKPSRGIVPNRGHFPPTEQALQQYIGTGPMCRYASDLKTMLHIMAGPNADFLRLDRQVELKNLKVFYMENDGEGRFTLPVKPCVRDAVRKVVNHFRRICDVPPQQVHIRGLKHGFKVWAYCLSAVVAGVARVESRVFGEDTEASVLKEFISCLFGWSQYSLPILATVVVEKLFGPKDKSEAEPFIRIQRQMEKDFQNLLQDDCIFIMPTLPEPAAYHYANTLRAQNCGYVATYNVLGLPATHCPVGLDKDGMPVGVQVISGWRNDHLNLAVAREIEREFGGWISPGPIV